MRLLVEDAADRTHRREARVPPDDPVHRGHYRAARMAMTTASTNATRAKPTRLRQ